MVILKLSKAIHRHGAVLMAGSMAAWVAAFSSAGFGSGRNVLAAYSQVYPGDKGLWQEQELILGAGRKDSLEGQEINAEAFADGAMEPEALAFFKQIDGKQNELTLKDASSESGRALIGSVLKQDTKEKQESEKIAKERVGQAQREIRARQVAEAARKAEEEIRKKEEEARKAALKIPYSQQDYQVLLRIVQAEAGGCDSTGKILVANVIMNRVRSSQFPDNITDVVYERSQFSPVGDGSINRVAVSQDTIECVNRALDGEDHSQGALYFMNRSASYSGNVSWFDRKLTYLFHHDGHEFFK